MTNQKAITQNFINEFESIDKDCTGVDIIVSFIQYSGFKLIKPFLLSLIKRNIPVRILTSTYLNITDPTALYALYDLFDADVIKLYHGNAPSFHPKAYFIHNQNQIKSKLYLGSSNISRAALTNGIEWNYCIDGATDFHSLTHFRQAFEDLYTYASEPLTEELIKAYAASYRQPLRKPIFLFPETKQDKNETNEQYEPNPAQCEALIALKNTREEGNRRAIIVSATGTGKTFLAAFDSLSFHRILFIAHREEILNQAYDTFSKIRNNNSFGRLYQSYRDYSQSIIFASVQTLARDKHLTQFKPTQFDYIIVDEVHHASATSYRKVMNYFNPSFLLGITATPYRLDRKNIFALCDDNLVYEIDLFQSINRGWLVPFKYYGIYDYTVNYQNVTYLNGSYDQASLNKAFNIEQRAELIFHHYRIHARQRAIGFCSSIAHAEFMTNYFKQQGIPSSAVYSGDNLGSKVERTAAITGLKDGIFNVIFSVDMLNEGVDIPAVDMVLFLRPTESPTIFLQQLGRGLRHYANKKDLKVLDFIGNYKKVDLLPFIFQRQTNDTPNAKEKALRSIIDNDNLPLDCHIHFDLKVVDLIQQAIRAKKKITDKILDWYDECKQSVGHIPSRVDFFTFIHSYEYSNIPSNLNPFRDYLSFLKQHEPTEIPEAFIKSNAYPLIHTIETTSMSQLYKLPVLLTFYNAGNVRTSITIDEIADCFIAFYENEINAKDLKRNKSGKDYKKWSKQQYMKLAINNPIHFLCKTHSNLFKFDGTTMSISLDLTDWLDKELFIEHFNDALEFRRLQFIDKRLNVD